MNTKVLTRYGNALYESYSEAGGKDTFVTDCIALRNLIAENKDLAALLKSPVIKKDLKISVIIKLFKNKMDNLLLNFLIVLIKNGRERYTSDILLNFLNVIDIKKGIIKPVFSTALELKDAEKKNIKKRLDAVTGKNSIPVFDIKEDLIGGFTVRIDDSIYDGSIKRQLELMKKSLKTQSI